MTMQPVPGSDRTPFRNAQATADADPSQTATVTLFLRSRARDAFDAAVHRCTQNAGVRMGREELAQQFGCDPADLDAVRTFAAGNGLTVVAADAGRRTVVLSGTVAQLSAAFGVRLQIYTYEGGTYRGRVGPVYVPDTLGDVVEAVLGLDDRPQASTHWRKPLDAAAAVPFTPLQVAQLYAYPSGAQHQCIGIVELGGGYTGNDVTAYFSELGIAAPQIVSVAVDGAQNAPTGDGNGPDAEVLLDIEVAGAIAQGARLAVYFAPNTDAGFLDAITTAVHDTTNKPSVISISWGGPESTWTQQATTAMDQAIAAAATVGVTVCVAAGDNGSSDGVGDGSNHVDFPASSTYALACGGTTLEAGGAAIASETVWNDGSSGGATGGGVSALFAAPTYQKNLHTTNASGQQSPLAQRGVPDVSGNADPQTGYRVRVDGSDTVVGGTSAVAPLWAALVAIVNANKGTSTGFINPRLYAATAALRDITQGNNGAFAASAGWDACTGLGTPNGQKVLASL